MSRGESPGILRCSSKRARHLLPSPVAVAAAVEEPVGLALQRLTCNRLRPLHAPATSCYQPADWASGSHPFALASAVLRFSKLAMKKQDIHIQLPTTNNK